MRVEAARSFSQQLVAVFRDDVALLPQKVTATSRAHRHLHVALPCCRRREAHAPPATASLSSGLRLNWTGEPNVVIMRRGSHGQQG